MFKSIGDAKLYYLKKNYDQLARQGSEAWFEGRRTRFGGSEIGTVVSASKGLENFCINKVKAKTFLNLYCWWGTEFENVAKKYYEYKHTLKIHEFGAIPSSNFPVAYSPDGVIVMNNDLYLIEIKCPFLRHLNTETKIQKNYALQVQMGMQIIPCDQTIFLQFKFRKCSYEELFKPGQYDKKFHNEHEKDLEEQIEIFSGAFFWETNNFIQEKVHKFHKPSNVYLSFYDKAFYKQINLKDKGYVMYFKCLYIKEDVIVKDPTFDKQYQDILWQNYNVLINCFQKLSIDNNRDI